MPFSNIDNPKKYFDSSLWSGTGATQSITSLNFQPDWLWVKSRSTASNHRSQNAVTGVTKGMNPNQTNAEDTLTDCVTSFNSNGFTLGVDSQGYVNTSPRTYVGWSWLASNTTVSNTSGTITSTVSANTTSGFSIVSYTGNGTSGSIGHGLSSTPAMIICKSRSDAEEWATYHQSLTYTKYIVLNSTAAAVSTARFYQAPTSSLFYVDNGYGVNKSSATYIAYCFAEVKGFSKFGSFSGNGSTDGTFVYTGFKPAFFLVKGSSNTSDWIMFDNKRDDINVVGRLLLPNSNGSESNLRASHYPLDFVSNGVKMRTDQLTGTTSLNASGVTYIYMAFAENPFCSSKGIPTTAR